VWRAITSALMVDFHHQLGREGADLTNISPPAPAGVAGRAAPRYTQGDEQRRRDELAREAAKQAPQQTERQRGPREGP
jgi:hypothetical protein